MARQPSRAMGRLALGRLGAIALASLATACSSSDSTSGAPSFLRVELVPVAQSGQTPQAVMAEINKTSSTIRLCINVAGKAGETTASFVLRRDPDLDPAERVQIKVVAFGALSGQNTAPAGKEFACPGSFPAPVAVPQELSIDFCPGESRRVVFNVGAQCSCAGSDGGACACAQGQTCSAGLSTMGSTCAVGECCNSELSSACALDPAH